MVTFTTSAPIEAVKPIPVRVGTGPAGRLAFAMRCLVDLQLATIWQALSKVLPELSGDLLDVGCGEMPFRFAVPDHVNYIGIDVPEAVSFGMHGHAEIREFDGRSIPFPDASFDTVLCTEVLEHCDDPAALVGEMHRVLQPGGLLVMTVPFAARVHHAPYDFQRFTRYGLARLLFGFDDIVIVPRGNDVAAIANKVIVLALRQFRLTHQAWWSVPLGAATLPFAALALLAAHASMRLGMGSADDPLGYAVTARKN